MTHLLLVLLVSLPLAIAHHGAEQQPLRTQRTTRTARRTGKRSRRGGVTVEVSAEVRPDALEACMYVNEAGQLCWRLGRGPFVTYTAD